MRLVTTVNVKSDPLGQTHKALYQLAPANLGGLLAQLASSYLQHSNHTKLCIPILGWSRAQLRGWLSDWLWVQLDTHMLTCPHTHTETCVQTLTSLCRSPPPYCMLFPTESHIQWSSEI